MNKIEFGKTHSIISIPLDISLASNETHNLECEGLPLPLFSDKFKSIQMYLIVDEDAVAYGEEDMQTVGGDLFSIDLRIDAQHAEAIEDVSLVLTPNFDTK